MRNTTTTRRTAILLLAAAAVAASCRTGGGISSVTSAMRTDTCYIERLRTDSIYVRDSINVREFLRGDTVYVWRDRWHTSWRDRIVRDSVYVTLRDTTVVTVTETVSVERKLTPMQQIRMHLGTGVLCVVCALVLYGMLWAGRKLS